MPCFFFFTCIKVKLFHLIVIMFVQSLFCLICHVFIRSGWALDKQFILGEHQDEFGKGWDLFKGCISMWRLVQKWGISNKTSILPVFPFSWSWSEVMLTNLRFSSSIVCSESLFCFFSLPSSLFQYLLSHFNDLLTSDFSLVNLNWFSDRSRCSAWVVEWSLIPKYTMCYQLSMKRHTDMVGMMSGKEAVTKA